VFCRVVALSDLMLTSEITVNSRHRPEHSVVAIVDLTVAVSSSDNWY